VGAANGAGTPVELVNPVWHDDHVTAPEKRPRLLALAERTCPDDTDPAGHETLDQQI
jgi:hypothetical protein